MLVPKLVFSTVMAWSRGIPPRKAELRIDGSTVAAKCPVLEASAVASRLVEFRDVVTRVLHCVALPRRYVSKNQFGHRLQLAIANSVFRMQ